jgi:hypothetical protein
MANPFRQLLRAASPSSRRSVRVPRRRARFQVKPLEDRLVPAVINVNTLVDSFNPGPGLTSLRSAIQQVNSGSDTTNTINLTLPGTYKITLAGTQGEFDNLAGEFAIFPTAGNLTIQNTSGGTVVVDGNHLNRVFDINPGNTDNAPAVLVNFEGFTIQNGDAFYPAESDAAPSSGGGIRDQANTSLTLTNMVVTNNVASADGGGVSMENAPASTPWTLTLNNTSVSDNHAGDAGGGVETDGAGHVIINGGSLTGNTTLNQGAAVWLDAIGVQSASLTINGTLVSHNIAQNGPTGAIGNGGNGAVTISNSTVEDNSSGTTGGGFGDQNNLGTLTVTNCVFQGNSAVGNGGGIQEGGPSTTIINSLIQGNSSYANGGGIFASGTTLTVLDSLIAGNTTSNNGGGVEVETTGTGTAGSTITSTTITGNSALNNANFNNHGGGVDEAVAGSLTLHNDTINGNYAATGGGVRWDGTGVLSVQNTIIAHNFGNFVGTDFFNDTGTVTDLGGNLVGVGSVAVFTSTDQVGTTFVPIDPLLGGLQNNGGPSVGAPGDTTPLESEALLSGSPAIGKAVVTGIPATDERGFRPTTFVLDVGAYQTHVAGTVWPLPDLALPHTSDPFQDVINVPNPTNAALTYTATVLTATAEVDKTLGLVFAGDSYVGYAGIAGEWLRSTNGSNAAHNGWYFLLPDGTLHQWDGGSTSATATGSPVVAAFDPSVYANPVLLAGAAAAGTAYSEEQLLDLAFAGDFYQTFGGINGKWLRSGNGSNAAHNGWYFLLQDGTLHQWDGGLSSATASSSPVVATLNETYWQLPGLLYNATPPAAPPAGVSAAFLGDSNVLQLSGYRDLVGSFGVEVGVGNGTATTTQDFLVTVTEQPPTLAPVTDQTVSHTASLTLTLAGSDADPNSALTYSARVYTDTPATEAFALRQQLGLAFKDSYYVGYAGIPGEWLRSGNGSNAAHGGWYFLMPDGTLHQWDGGSTSATATGSPVVGTPGAAYYANPALLLNAQPTPAPAGVTATVAGNEVTFGNFGSFTGTLFVVASVSDGILTASTTFRITVT